MRLADCANCYFTILLNPLKYVKTKIKIHYRPTRKVLCCAQAYKYKIANFGKYSFQNNDFQNFFLHHDL